MSATDRTVLILGDDPAFVERYVPLLRRCHLSVQRLICPSGPIQFAEQAPKDLVVLVPPLANAARLFARARAAGSPWRQTGVLLVAERIARSALDPAITRFANRMVAPEASQEELEREIADLLAVAPRVAVHASVELRLVPHEGGARTLPVENLSATGMFVALEQPLPVGTVFGFALNLPTEREPILGQAGVVRKAVDSGPGRTGNGVRFLSFGGEGGDRIARLVLREREQASGVRRNIGATTPPPPVTSSGVTARPATPELAQLKEEQAELSALLDERLARGLTRRLGSADWYLTGMELGLDSLQAVAALLEALHAGRAASFGTQNRIADLAFVRRKLVEFAQPQQEVRQRVQILLDLRSPLERLRQQLGTDRQPGGSLASDPHRAHDFVLQTVAEIRRLVASRRSLANVRILLHDLGSTAKLFVPGAQRRTAERIVSEHRGQVAALGVASPEALANRDGRKRALAAVEQEIDQLGRRLATVHERLYTRRFRHLASGDFDAELTDPRVTSILAETVAPGRDYLERAFSAYRHALDAVGAEPALLERAAQLSAAIRAAELERSGAVPHSPAASERGA